ncbi:hypothetical protein HU200_053029 [Digitaria exilis]|uniref:F-box domain-containing protein n=1 Tax=Digitaria exilis TaxID=1010633 RepID=A0A835AN65_9POAL|nr:hypothetical protein HU200_053029 [Digitaria exilis]
MDELVGEILLRLPPAEPEHLFRASLVCKQWVRVLCHPSFGRRYHVFHGAPPILGLLHRLQVLQGPAPTRFASTTSMPDFPHPGSDGHYTLPLDCRHCRVLVRMRQPNVHLLVWDPVTGDKHSLLEPRIERGTLIGDAMYFTIRLDNTIIKYERVQNCLSMINPPSKDVYYIALMAMEDDSLGFACTQGSSLYLWSMELKPKGAAEWVQRRVIKLETIIPAVNPSYDPLVVGSAEGVGFIFISTDAGLFTIDLKSGKVQKGRIIAK